MATRETVFENKNYQLNYEILNKDFDRTILFLHGWGSNREIMKMAFKNNFKDWKHLYLDMSGFGESSEPHRPLITKDYEIIISNFLNEINIVPEIIIGHSFGGKVATLLNPKHLVLLSSAGILEPKPIKIKVKIAIFKLFKFFKLENLRNIFVATDGKNLSENMYGTFKNVVNEDFSEIFKNRNINYKTTIFWGIEDRATSLSSGKKISELIKNSEFHPMTGDHYFFIKQSNKIEENIK